ncbi:bile acid:sodium symporter [Akkermansiaceae bacterium]|nr:bile acid:sodium symporter [Akkermansiaceae bacterium]
MIGSLKRNSFVIGLGLAVLLAWLTPDWGASGGKLSSQLWNKVGIIIIFLTQGFGLSTESVASGFKNWRLHLFTQFWISLGAPLLVLAALALAGELVPPGLRIALFFLSVLPTTVSSAVALIVEADGNVAGGVFNTVLSNLLGVVIVPVAVVAFSARAGDGAPLDVVPALKMIVSVVLLPFIVGHFLRKPLIGFVPRVKKIAGPLNQLIICFMVYASFSTSFRDAVWDRVGAGFAVAGFVAALALLVLMSLAVWASARWMLRDAQDRVSAFYCGSQKSLAVGVPYAAAIFTLGGGGVDPSVVLLPLLFYHPLQLLLGSALIRWRGRLFG